MSRRRMMYGILDKDVSAFIKTAGITDSVQKKAINYLVSELKKTALWSKFSAIYPFVGGTAHSHKFNLINPTVFQITWGSGAVHNSKGVQPNNSNNNTGIYTNYMLNGNDFHFSMYPQTHVISLKTVDVGQLPSTDSRVGCHLTWGTTTFFQAGDGLVTGNVNVSSLIIMNRYSNTMTVSRNGVNVLSKGVSGVVPNLPMYFNGTVYNDTVSSNSRVFSLLTFGNGLTDSQKITFNNIIQQYQTILGRAV